MICISDNPKTKQFLLPSEQMFNHFLPPHTSLTDKELGFQCRGRSAYSPATLSDAPPAGSPPWLACHRAPGVSQETSAVSAWLAPWSSPRFPPIAP